ncbi:MAG: YfhO family protein [Pseudonocardia sp.]|nr:YfhO family protein [Pseudonocardia sp.]
MTTDDAATSRTASGPGRPMVAAVLLAIALFTLIGIGGPLVGLGVFAGTDLLVQSSPYRDAGLAGGVDNTYINDTIDTFIPNTLLFADALRDGEIAAWNPYILGGVPLGATPNFAVASPLTVPFYVLPGWLAPGYVKLLEIAASVGGVFLFARRVGLGRPAALVGGLVFASSGFMIAWTNWPQTRTAAVIGFVFWAVERLVQRGRAVDGVLLAVAVAAMLVGGFPAVTGYTLFFAGLYLLVRVVAQHRAGRWGTDLRVLVAAGAGVVAGALLTAVQLLPFAATLSAALVAGRAQTPQDHLPYEALITAVAPRALGTVNPEQSPEFLLETNLVEALSYVGAAALVLMLVAVASPVRGRGLLPRSTWAFLVVATVLTTVLAYGGGPLLAAAQQLPVLFSDNYVGRVRSVLGFGVAVLAATGWEVVVRGRARTPAAQAPTGGRVYGALVWTAAAATGVWVWWGAREVARAADAVALFDREVLVAVLLVVLSLAVAALLRWGSGGPALRVGVAALLPVLITVQALGLVREYWPRSDRSTFYPVTDVQRFLADELGHERYAHTLGGMAVGADAPRRLRSLNGHIFVNGRFADLIEALPGDQFGDPPTLPVLGADPLVATSPVLDRTGIRYFVASPAQRVFGERNTATGDGSTVRLVPDSPVTVPLDPGDTLRAVAVTPRAPLRSVPPGAPSDLLRVEIVLRDADGTVVGRGSRIDVGMRAGRPFTIPVVETTGAATAELTVRGHGAVVVSGTDGVPVVSTVTAADDGLRLVHAGSSVVYERETALPRIRWATDAVVEPDPRRRVRLVASGRLDPDQVVLDAPAPVDDPGPADVDVVTDGFDEITVAVDAAGGGYLVVADALQTGWRVRVDGRPAEVLAADHGVVAVAVPAGRHTVTWNYGSTALTVGAWTSVVTAAALLVVLGAAGLRRRRSTSSG